MRYLITIVAISAFALMAGSAQAWDDQFGPVNDTALPDSSSTTLLGTGFASVNWQIDFQTPILDPGGRTIVLVKIDNTNVQGDSSPDEEWIDSDDYGNNVTSSKSGSDSIIGTPLRGRLECHATECDQGHFKNMYLGYDRIEP